MSEELFTEYMRLKGEAERWGFTTSEKRPSPEDCEQFVCIHPCQMVWPEFTGFVGAAMKKEEVQNLIIAGRRVEKDSNYNKKTVYDFRTMVNPKTLDVEVVVTCPIGDYGAATGLFARTLDLFGVSLAPEDKISYDEFYKSESKTRESLANFGSKAYNLVKVPFAYVGRGIVGIDNAISSRWDERQNNRKRQMREIKDELHMNGIPQNIKRTGSCYVGINKACVIKKIEKKKEEAKAAAS